jgi:hypothetical protein
MLTYNLTRKDKSKFKINIKLADTPFANEWKDYMIALSSRLPEINWGLRIGGCKSEHYQKPDVNLLKNLLQAFTFLQNNIGADFNKEIKDLNYLVKNPNDLRQHHLNVWHRHFTTQATEWYSGRMCSIEESDAINNLKSLEEKINHWNQEINKIKETDLSELINSVNEELDLKTSNQFEKNIKSIINNVGDILNKNSQTLTKLSTELKLNKYPGGITPTREDLFKSVHTLNQAVHDLEGSTYRYLKNIELIKGKWISFIACTNSKEFKNKDALFGNGNELRLTDRVFNPETEEFHYSVWLAEDKQGKDQIKAWLEDDDLSASDCTGNLFMTPNLILDPYMIFASVMENPDWQKQHLESGKPVNRFPIGNIVDLETIDWHSLRETTIDSVIIDDIVLWQSNKIAFGVYDQLSHKSKSYRDHVNDITMFGINVALNKTLTDSILVEGNDINKIMKSALKQNSKHLFLVSLGYQSHAHELVHQIIKEAQQNNYAFVGHILEDKHTGYFYLHDQSLYVNLKIWESLGCPKFGDSRNISNEELSLPDRSTDDIHDDYTPTYLKPTGQTKQYSGLLRPGADFISAVLAGGYAFGNFSRQVRDQKYHLYPDIADDRFERILQGEKGITVEETGPTYGQFRYLEETSFNKSVTSLVFVFNNDPVELPKLSYNINTKLDTLYSVAAGFKPLQILTQTDWADSRVVYIDYSRPALDFKKWLVDTWDGKNYLEKIKEYQQIDPTFKPIWLPNKDFSPEWFNTLSLFDGEQSWLKIWNQYRNLPHRYILTDLFGNYKEMLDDMSIHQGNNFIWFSNSFYNPASIRNFSPSTLDSLYSNFIKNLKKNNKSIHLGGCDNRKNSAWVHYGDIQ